MIVPVNTKKEKETITPTQNPALLIVIMLLVLDFFFYDHTNTTNLLQRCLAIPKGSIRIDALNPSPRTNGAVGTTQSSFLVDNGTRPDDKGETIHYFLRHGIRTMSTAHQELWNPSHDRLAYKKTGSCKNRHQLFFFFIRRDRATNQQGLVEYRILIKYLKKEGTHKCKICWGYYSSQ